MCFTSYPNISKGFLISRNVLYELSEYIKRVSHKSECALRIIRICQSHYSAFCDEMRSYDIYTCKLNSGVPIIHIICNLIVCISYKLLTLECISITCFNRTEIMSITFKLKRPPLREIYEKFKVPC